MIATRLPFWIISLASIVMALNFATIRFWAVIRQTVNVPVFLSVRGFLDYVGPNSRSR